MPRTVRDVVFVDGVRTPFGKAGPKGIYHETRADDLVVKAIRELLRRNPGLDPKKIDEVAIAATTQIGDQGLTLGRTAGILAGLPQSVPGYSIDRMCAGALTAVTTAAGSIAFGAYDAVIAGGVEHMGRHPMGEGVDPNPRFVSEKLVDESALFMGMTAENLHDRYPHITKLRADEYAVRSQEKAAKAYANGKIQADLVPISVRRTTPEGGETGWGLVTPAHWLVGRDDVHLVDPAQLALDEAEAATLHGALAPLFEELGWTWKRAGIDRWYVSHPTLATLPSASTDRVIGRNVDLWLNDHPGALLVRRLQSEVQMLLYVHPLNDERSARGALPVNSFWLAGTGPAQPAGAALPGDVRVDDRLRAPALADDWSAWAEAWHESPYGRIESSWRADGGRFVWDILVPPGATAEAIPPGREAVCEGAENREGCFELPAGRWRIEATL